MRRAGEAPSGLTNLLLANVIDSIRALAAGLGGKKLKTSQMVSPLLTAKGAAKAEKRREIDRNLVEGLRSLRAMNSRQPKRPA